MRLELTDHGDPTESVDEFQNALCPRLLRPVRDCRIASSQPAQRQVPTQPDTTTVSSAVLRQLTERLTEVRRDQLNYQIERDLLKETYSSNLATVQLVLAMILGAFTVLGYLGLKSIGGLRADFQLELDQFRGAKSQVEKQLQAVEEAQVRADAQVQKLATENAEQDRRLRGLELRERATKLFVEGNYSLAFEYLIVGLQMSPGDSVMLALKANCLSKLGRVTEAIVVHQQVLKATPDDRSTIVNLLEAFLLAGRRTDFEDLAATHADAIVAHSPLLGWYFTALKFLVSKDVPSLIAHIEALSVLTSTEPVKKLNWNFDDARVMLASRSDLPGAALFLTIMNVLEGKEAPAALTALAQSAGGQGAG